MRQRTREIADSEAAGATASFRTAADAGIGGKTRGSETKEEERHGCTIFVSRGIY